MLCRDFGFSSQDSDSHKKDKLKKDGGADSGGGNSNALDSTSQRRRQISVSDSGLDSGDDVNNHPEGPLGSGDSESNPNSNGMLENGSIILKDPESQPETEPTVDPTDADQDPVDDGSQDSLTEIPAGANPALSTSVETGSEPDHESESVSSSRAVTSELPSNSENEPNADAGNGDRDPVNDDSADALRETNSHGNSASSSDDSPASENEEENELPPSSRAVSKEPGLQPENERVGNSIEDVDQELRGEDSDVDESDKSSAALPIDPAASVDLQFAVQMEGIRKLKGDPFLKSLEQLAESPGPSTAGSDLEEFFQTLPGSEAACMEATSEPPQTGDSQDDDAISIEAADEAIACVMEEILQQIEKAGEEPNPQDFGQVLEELLQTQGFVHDEAVKQQYSRAMEELRQKKTPVLDGHLDTNDHSPEHVEAAAAAPPTEVANESGHIQEVPQSKIRQLLQLGRRGVRNVSKNVLKAMAPTLVLMFLVIREELKMDGHRYSWNAEEFEYNPRHSMDIVDKVQRNAEPAIALLFAFAFSATSRDLLVGGWNGFLAKFGSRARRQGSNKDSVGGHRKGSLLRRFASIASRSCVPILSVSLLLLILSEIVFELGGSSPLESCYMRFESWVGEFGVNVVDRDKFYYFWLRTLMVVLGPAWGISSSVIESWFRSAKHKVANVKKDKGGEIATVPVDLVENDATMEAAGDDVHHTAAVEGGEHNAKTGFCIPLHF